jgi:hypothetical protein
LHFNININDLINICNPYYTLLINSINFIFLLLTLL